MTAAVVAYVPVLHEGYRRFLDAHARGQRAFVVGPELYVDYRPLAKDIRCLDAHLVAIAIASWEMCSSVTVLDVQGAERLADEGVLIIMPAEDISHQISERFFSRATVRYDPVFLRWDKSRSVCLMAPRAVREVLEDEVFTELALAAEIEAARSIDWWRQVGAAIRFADGRTAAAMNEHLPHPLSAYACGDPRSNFFKGVNLEISTAVHAEARLIADAARSGISTEGATLFVTDFPCPPCAKLIAGAGISKLYYREGYALLDGNDVLEDAGVEIGRVCSVT